MKEIRDHTAQTLMGHTSEVANLPTTEAVLPDGTHFNAACGSQFIDVDAGDVWLLYENQWYKAGGNT